LFLLKNYFRFTGPVQKGEALRSNDPQSSAKLIAVPLSDLADANMHLLAGESTHLVAIAPDCFDEAFLLLSCLCESGYPIGEAVRNVNAALRGDGLMTNGSNKERLWLVGDPTLRLFPSRPSTVETKLEAVNDSWKVPDRPSLVLDR